MVRREGLGPSTPGLKVSYSTTELPAHMVPPQGLGPWTHGLRDRCSTD